jgi:hypothetical protein
MELVLYHLPDDTVHASGFSGHDTGFLQLDAMAQVYPVFIHSRLIRIVETDVPVVLFVPRLN